MLYNVIGTAIIVGSAYGLISTFYYTGVYLYSVDGKWGLKTTRRDGPSEFERFSAGLVAWAAAAFFAFLAAAIFAAGGHLARYLFRAAA